MLGWNASSPAGRVRGGGGGRRSSGKNRGCASTGSHMRFLCDVISWSPNTTLHQLTSDVIGAPELPCAAKQKR